MYAGLEIHNLRSLPLLLPPLSLLATAAFEALPDESGPKLIWNGDSSVYLPLYGHRAPEYGLSRSQGKTTIVSLVTRILLRVRASPCLAG